MEIIEEYFLYDMDSFVSDVGGFLGLLLGASILSLVEELIVICARKKQTTPDSS